MDRKLQILLIAGIIITAILFLFNIYAAGIFFVILAAVAMVYFVMLDSTFLPDVVAELQEHAKGIVIRNTGNALAKNIHVALVPENIEFDVHPLEAEESYTYPLERMIEEVKVVITFENERGNTFSRSYRLNAFGENFEPLKPMIPLFKWK
jgi:hypothetical protein